MSAYRKALVWFRRDIRIEDQTALARASQEADALAFVFVFDTNILAKLTDRDDSRLSFLWRSIEELDRALRARGGTLILRKGDPAQEIPLVAKELGVGAVYTNRDYEPYAKSRDEQVKKSLKALGVDFLDFKDQVIFESREILSGVGQPFKVFTPYKNAWLKALQPNDYKERKAIKRECIRSSLSHDLSLDTLGFKPGSLWLQAGEAAAGERLRAFGGKKISAYKTDRDFPSVEGTSGLSVHLRFGTISIRKCVRMALAKKSEGHDTWLSELIWREFYQMILDQFPHVVGKAFKADYEKIRWPGEQADFESWCAGETGFPIVDAAMRHFNATGWMHNRLRMVVASFLTKDLLCDWRWGESYFARKLLDFDLAANNGGWQWSASTGCDAQPYFRIFNPLSQSERFDKNGDFIRSQLPELAHLDNKTIHAPSPMLAPRYRQPIVDHKTQRTRALALFAPLKGKRDGQET